MRWRAGMTMTDARLNNWDDLDDSTTTGATAASGWSLTTFSGRRKSGTTTVNLLLNRTGALIGESSAGSGNVTGDPAVVTLPSGWCPPENMVVIGANGSNAGDIAIDTNGICTIRSTTGSAGFATASNIRINASWLD